MTDRLDGVPHDPDTAPARPVSRAPRLLARTGANIVSAGRFAAARRRDLRFRIVPFDGWAAANLLALAGSSLLLAMLFLDPYAPAWRRALPGPVEAAFEAVTRAGKSDWILVGTALFVLWGLARDAGALPRRAHLRLWTRTAATAYVFLAVALSGLLSVLLKYAIGRGRPRHFDEFGAFAFRFGEFDASWASFPSGHATTAMALAAGLALLFPRLRAVFLCAGFWIAFSRVVTGAHHPSDLMAGGLVGAGTAWLVARAFARRRLAFRFDATGAVRPRPWLR